MRQLDLAHVEGGFFRVGDRVVDAEGNDLGQEGIDLADQIDNEHKEEAEQEAEKARQLASEQASGGFAGLVQRMFGITDPAVRESARHLPMTTPRAASQEDQPRRIGMSAATTAAAPGPTPVPTRGATITPSTPAATTSVADDMPDAETVLKENESRTEEQGQTRPRLAATAPAPASPRKKGAPAAPVNIE
jgi:hypothetical protein